MLNWKRLVLCSTYVYNIYILSTFILLPSDYHPRYIHPLSLHSEPILSSAYFSQPTSPNPSSMPKTSGSRPPDPRDRDDDNTSLERAPNMRRSNTYNPARRDRSSSERGPGEVFDSSRRGSPSCSRFWETVMEGEGASLYSETPSNYPSSFNVPSSVKSYPLQGAASAASSSRPVPDRTATTNKSVQGKPLSSQLFNATFSIGNEPAPHYKTYHPDRPGQFECGMCSMAFVLQSAVSNHEIAVHDMNRPFKCEKCDKSFGRNYALKKHIESVHEKKRPFSCKICHSVFANKGNLKRHITNLHLRMP